MKRLFTLTVSLLFLVYSTKAAVIGYNCTAATASTTAANTTASAITSGNNNGTTTLISTTSASSGYTGATGTGNAGAAARTGVFDAALSAYFEVTITPSSGTLNITGLSFGSRSTGTGPQGYSIRSSNDNFASDVTTGTLLSNSTWALNSPSVNLSKVGAITLRIYGVLGTGSPSANTANWRIDDINVTVDVVLAVENKSLSATKNAVSNILKWQTTSEKNNALFNIERSSNGETFNKIGEVKGNGTTNVAQTYTFMDASPVKGLNYYRLRQVDFDGTETLSKTVSVNFDGKGSSKIKVYPTLVQDVVNVENTEGGKAEIAVRDVAGRLILTQNTDGPTNQALNLGSLSRGLYLLSVRSNDGIETVKIYKQ
jgi:Secretion system C-terminal sorting domain